MDRAKTNCNMDSKQNTSSTRQLQKCEKLKANYLEEHENDLFLERCNYHLLLRTSSQIHVHSSFISFYDMDNTQTLSAHTCTCNGVQELLKINAHWSHCYNVLLKKYRGLEDVEKKYHNLKRQLKETKEMLRSFEEAACIFSMADFELLKNELISYKNMVDRETLEREKLTQHNQNLENQLKILSKETEIFASENKTLKKDMKQLHNERNNLIDQVKTWFDSLKGYPASNISDKTAVESFFQDTQGEDIVKTEKNCQIVESLLLKSEKCVL